MVTAAFPAHSASDLQPTLGGVVSLRRFILAFGLLLTCAVLGTTSAVGATRVATRGDGPHRKAVHFYRHEVHKWRSETWYWQRLMGVRRSHRMSRSLESVSVKRLRRLAAVWRRREKRAHRHAKHPPHLAAWMCIHHYEGSWTDHGAPYWGGLQMSLEFQRVYGGWLLRKRGTADHWTMLEQIWTATKAERARGFYPWPNTARFCGLI